MDICDWKTPWLGDSSMWLDKCSDVTTTPPQVSMRSQAYTPSVSNMWLWGGATPNQDGCFWFAAWQEWPPYYAFAANYALKALGDNLKLNSYDRNLTLGDIFESFGFEDVKKTIF